jgi:hypothetical protein
VQWDRLVWNRSRSTTRAKLLRGFSQIDIVRSQLATDPFAKGPGFAILGG